MALKDFLPMMERCSNCLGCKWIPFDKIQSQRFGENCPTNLYYQWHMYSLRGKWQVGQAYLTGDYDFKSSPEWLNAVQSCTACGACDVTCKITRFNLEGLDYCVELKNEAVLKGFATPEQKAMIDSLKKEQTLIAGEKKAKRQAWAKGIKWAKDAEVVFFPGCKYSYDKDLQAYAKKAAETLIAAGVKLGYMGDLDMCCAGRAYQMGFFDEFGERADANIKAFEAKGVKTIVTPCSDCYHAFKTLYAKRGMNIEVLHITEYLDKLIKEKKIKFKKNLDMVVTYHDPCHLGRQGEPYTPWEGEEKKIMNQVVTWEPRRPRRMGVYGIYDAPRDVIKAIPGVTLVEMERIREYSLCCGAGANVQITNPEMSKATASERITEANTTGADALVTACPWCEANFKNAVGENGKGIEVIDIIDLVARAL